MKIEKTNWIIALIMPPVIGAIYYIHNVFAKKNWKSIVPLMFLYSLILVYTIQSYDNRIRFLSIERMDIYSNVFGDHALNWLVYFVKQIVDIDCTFFFFIYTFLCLFFYYVTNKCIHREFNNNIAIITLTAITVKNLFDLTYYTFSVVFLLFSLYYFDREWKKIIVAVLGCYVIHPAALILLAFSFPLYLLIKQNKIIVSYTYIIVLVCIFSILFVANRTFSTVGWELLDIYLEKGSSYMDSDNFWADSNNIVSTLRMQIFFIFEKFIYVCFLILGLRSIKQRLLDPMLLSLVIVSSLLYFATVDTITFNERFGVSTYIIGVTALPLWARANFRYISLNGASYLCMIMFALSLYFHPLVQRHIFSDGEFPSEISKRKYYIPSTLLLNIDEYGLSDEVMNRKMK